MLTRTFLAMAVAAVCAASVPAAGSAATATPARGSHSMKSTPAEVLPFIDDSYTKAVAEARARKVPIFVEAWAPW